MIRQTKTRGRACAPAVRQPRKNTATAAPGCPPARPEASGGIADAVAEVLSPSQVRTYLDCSAKWWYSTGLNLPDPPGAALIRGRVMHQVVEMYYRARLAGDAPTFADLDQPFALAWESECDGALFVAGDDVDALRDQAAAIAARYLGEVAPKIDPAGVELPVAGRIGGVEIHGIVDLLDTSGRIIDLKSAARKPAGVAASYGFQIATYSQLLPQASGEARIDTAVCTKTPSIVTMSYTVSAADRLMTERVYPRVQQAMRDGMVLPNRGSNLCSRKYCNFWAECEDEFGGRVKQGKAE